MYAYLRKFGIDIVYISIIFIILFINYSTVQNNQDLVNEYNSLAETCQGNKIISMYKGVLVFNYTMIGEDNATATTPTH